MSPQASTAASAARARGAAFRFALMSVSFSRWHRPRPAFRAVGIRVREALPKCQQIVKECTPVASI